MELLVFILGGISYGIVEILFRGYTHWTMVLTGGAVVLTFYLLVPIILNLNVFVAALTGALIITLYEFFVGMIVNVCFHWDVWDYTMRPGNIMGQICPTYSACWFGICLVFFSLIKYNKSIFF